MLTNALTKSVFIIVLHHLRNLNMRKVFFATKCAKLRVTVIRIGPAGPTGELMNRIRFYKNEPVGFWAYLKDGI